MSRKVLQLVTGLYGRMGYPLSEDDPELGRMLRPLDKERLEEQLTGQIGDEPKPTERGRGGKPGSRS